MIKKGKKSFKVTLSLLPVLLLPGCFSSSEKSSTTAPEDALVEQQEVIVEVDQVLDGSPVVALVNGRPALTINMVNEKFDQLIEENEQAKKMMQMLPSEEDRNRIKFDFFQSMVNQLVVDEYIQRNGIDQSRAYQQRLAKMTDQMRLMLNYEAFSNAHPAEVSKIEAKRFYDENKDKVPGFIQSQGGVKAEGVQFKEQAEAEAFLEKFKASNECMDKLAAGEGIENKYNDFKIVHMQSMQIDPALRAKLISISSFPTTELINVGSDWWVVHASGKTESLYVPFDAVEADVIAYLKKPKQDQNDLKMIEQYKIEYGIEIDPTPFNFQGGGQTELAYEEMALSEEPQHVARTA